jgi:hypothetical protein
MVFNWRTQLLVGQLRVAETSQPASVLVATSGCSAAAHKTSFARFAALPAKSKQPMHVCDMCVALPFHGALNIDTGSIGMETCN